MLEETDRTAKARPTTDRAVIAKWVIGCSGIVLVVLTITLIYLNGLEGSKTAFNMLVPMIGTWIGTVIAYYFSGENFQRASDSVNRMVSHVIADKLKTINVKDAMIWLGTMTVVKLPADGDASKVSFKTELLDRFNENVTRLPVLDDKGVASTLFIRAWSSSSWPRRQ